MRIYEAHENRIVETRRPCNRFSKDISADSATRFHKTKVLDRAASVVLDSRYRE